MIRKRKPQQSGLWEGTEVRQAGFSPLNGGLDGIGEGITFFVLGIFVIIALSFWISFSAFGGWF